MRTVDRTQIILETLIHHDGYVTASDLAEVTGVTARTIREDIKLLAQELSEHHIPLRSVPSKGYCIAPEDKDKAASYFDTRCSRSKSTPTLPAERIQAIIHQLLFKADAVSMDKLMDRLCISRSTLEKDLQEIEKWLTIHKLKLLKSRDGSLILQGKEIAIRYALINYFWSFEDVKEATIIAALQRLMQRKDIVLIQDTLHNLLPGSSYTISDAEYLNLLMYISFSLWRFENHHLFENGDGEEPIALKPGSAALVELLAGKIEQKTTHHIPESEKRGLVRFLSQSTLMDEDPAPDSVKNTGEYDHFVRNILLQLRTIYSVDLSEDNLLADSLVHYIHSLVQHSAHKAYIKNPSLDEIRKEYPQALEMAVAISDSIHETYQIMPDEDEIGFIALYLCAALERAMIAADLPPQKVVIICATGMGGSQLLSVKIQRNFNTLQIMGVYPAFLLHQAIQKDPDFIISTIPLENPAIPVVHIGHVLNDDDLAAISHFLKVKRSKSSVYFEDAFYNLFRPEILFTRIPASDRSSVIQNMCDHLQQLDLVDSGYARSVMEREAIFSTAIGNLVAIPHALNIEGLDPFISVAILPRSIPWGTEKAQLIFLLHLAPASKQHFNAIYGKLFDVVNEKKKVEKILRTQNYPEFLQVLHE